MLLKISLATYMQIQCFTNNSKSMSSSEENQGTYPENICTAAEGSVYWLGVCKFPLISPFL
jgi:hypothetical protein